MYEKEIKVKNKVRIFRLNELSLSNGISQFGKDDFLHCVLINDLDFLSKSFLNHSCIIVHKFLGMIFTNICSLNKREVIVCKINSKLEEKSLLRKDIKHIYEVKSVFKNYN